MDLALITVEQVSILFLLILVGFAGVKAKIIQPESRKVFSSFLVSVVMPMVILNSYMSEFDPDILTNLIWSFIFSTVVMGLGFVISFLLMMKSKSKNKAILTFGSMFSNSVYMGFPLIQAMFGTEGMLYTSAFVTMFNVFVWTIGYVVVSGKPFGKEVLKNVITNPVLISIGVGLVIYLGRIPVPEIVKQPVSLIANMNTSLSMIIIGMVIASSNMKQFITNKEVWALLLCRLIIIPAVCFALFYVLGIGGMVANVVLILQACPTAAITSVFAIQFNHDENLAAGAVVLTTLCSIVTLPIFAMLLTMLT